MACKNMTSGRAHKHCAPSPHACTTLVSLNHLVMSSRFPHAVEGLGCQCIISRYSSKQSRMHACRFGGASGLEEDRAARKLEVDEHGIARRVSDDIWSNATSRYISGALCTAPVKCCTEIKMLQDLLTHRVSLDKLASL